MHGTDAESSTADALRRLLRTHNLDAWLYTKRIDIDEQAYPHSHPVLTLNASHLSDEHLLAAFLHEQLHWYEETYAVRRDAAIETTRQLYPEVPACRPKGAGDETSTRLHLLVCLLEYRVLHLLLGHETAARIIDELGRHHYFWVYRTVRQDAERIEAILRAHNLLPLALADLGKE